MILEVAPPPGGCPFKINKQYYKTTIDKNKQKERGKENEVCSNSKSNSIKKD